MNRMLNCCGMPYDQVHLKSLPIGMADWHLFLYYFDFGLMLETNQQMRRGVDGEPGCLSLIGRLSSFFSLSFATALRLLAPLADILGLKEI